MFQPYPPRTMILRPGWEQDGPLARCVAAAAALKAQRPPVPVSDAEIGAAVLIKPLALCVPPTNTSAGSSSARRPSPAATSTAAPAGSCIAHESRSGLGRPGGQAPKPQSGARSAGLDGTDPPQAIIRRVTRADTVRLNQVQDLTATRFVDRLTRAD